MDKEVLEVLEELVKEGVYEDMEEAVWEYKVARVRRERRIAG